MVASGQTSVRPKVSITIPGPVLPVGMLMLMAGAGADACAGYLPNDWPTDPPQHIVAPYRVPLNATAEAHEQARRVRRAHPMFRDVTLRLLTEVINSRLFTTVRPPLSLILHPVCLCPPPCYLHVFMPVWWALA